MIREFCLALAALSTACARPPTTPQPVGHQPAEETAVLAVMDAYMHEISANDLAAMDARQTAEGMTYRHAARPDGGWDVIARSNKCWVAPERADDHTYGERYWSPTVMIRGSMALSGLPTNFRSTARRATAASTCSRSRRSMASGRSRIPCGRSNRMRVRNFVPRMIP